MNFVALPESNNQIIEVTNHTLVCVGKLAYESAGTAVQGCSAFGGRVDFANSLFYWVTGHVHDTYQVGNSEKETDTSTNIQALCCSHVVHMFYEDFLAFLAFLARPLSEIEANWKGQAEQESDHAMRLETKADRDSFSLLKIELHDVH